MSCTRAQTMNHAYLLPCLVLGIVGCGDQPSGLELAPQDTTNALTITQRVLIPDDLKAGDGFGWSLATGRDQGGHWIAAGACMHDVNGTDSGAVYTFHKDSTNDWTMAKMTDPNPARYNYFGSALGMTGSFLAIGAYGSDDHGSASGAVHTYYHGYPFDYIGKLSPDDGAASDYFGSSMYAAESALYQFLAVGAYGDDDKGSNSGSVYLYRREHSRATYPWIQLKKLVASDGHANQRFGNSLHMQSYFGTWTAEATLAIGAHGDNNHGSQTGAVYLYDRYQGGDDNWGLVKKIVPDDAHSTLLFGYSVAVISGDADWDFLAVGAPYDNVHGAYSGSTYVFQRNRGGANNWGQLAKITPPDGATSDRFGDAVTYGTRGLMIAAPGDDDAGIDSGSVYLYDWNAIKAGDTSKYTKITASPAHAGDKFGAAMQVSLLPVIGAPYNDVKGTNAGAIYLVDVPE